VDGQRLETVPVLDLRHAAPSHRSSSALTSTRPGTSAHPAW
jgi:hypothetical protein